MIKTHPDVFASVLMAPLHVGRGLVIRRLKDQDIQALPAFYRAAADTLYYYSRRDWVDVPEIEERLEKPFIAERAFWKTQLHSWNSKSVNWQRIQYYFVFNADKKIVGIIQTYWEEGKPTLGYYSMPTYRRKGYMKTAIEPFVKKLAHHYGVKRLHAMAEADNTASHKTLRRTRFKVTSAIRKAAFYPREGGQLMIPYRVYWRSFAGHKPIRNKYGF